MATNLKGKGKFVSLLLLHGEKIAIGLVALASLWIVYKSFKVDKLDAAFQADKLDSEITQTNSAISAFTWDQAVADHPDKVKKAIPIADKGKLEVNFGDYVPMTPDGKPGWKMDDSIVAPLILREDPVILNPIDLRATGGSGLFAFVDEEIRKQQALRQAEEAAEAEKRALEKQKKDAKAAENAGNKRGARPDAGMAANEPIDPAHPKRRMVTNPLVRPTANILQGGERIERAYWACVTAKVPIRQQLKLYQDALEKARGADPVRDFPGYVGFFVERSEVLPGKELEWKPVPLYDGQRSTITEGKSLSTANTSHVVAKPAFDKLVNAATAFWAGGITADVIDSRFAEFPLTLPLPPLIGREWGAEATHPDIPLAINTPPLETEAPPVDATAPDAANGAPSDGFGSAAPGAGAVTGPGFPGGRPPGEFGGPGAGRRMGPGGGPEMMAGMGPGGRSFAGGPGGPEGGGSYRGGGGAGGVAPEHTVLPKGVDFYLLRFFDFSVEPGKKYKYRVKLVLKDPNFNMQQSVLSPAVLDRQAKEVIATKKKKSDLFYRVVDKWSDPTPAVGIPMAGNVRLAEAKMPAADKVNDEPTVKLLVEAFDVDATGAPIQAAAERDFRRGSVANFIQETEYLVNPTMIDTQPNFRFLTGMTLLDVDGGGKLVRDLTVPSRVLVMGPAGEMYIRSELEDKPFVQMHRMTFEKTNDRLGAPGGAEMPGGPGGPGGRGRPRTQPR